MKILLVEDDTMIGENIQIALVGEGCSVDWVMDGLAAEAALESMQFDAMLLDLSLPHKDGVDVLQSLRARKNDIPVLVMTARDTVPQRILGLNMGADDYLVKPFDLEELIARLRALVRRSRGGLQLIYRHGDITVNSETRQVFAAERQIALSSREWTVLEALVARPGAILSRAQLEDRLYGYSGEVESNAVEVYIYGLRKKLGQQFIVNIRGLGYMVEKV